MRRTTIFVVCTCVASSALADDAGRGRVSDAHQTSSADMSALESAARVSVWPMVEATLDSADLRVDRKRAREDAASYLLVVLDTSGGKREQGPVANGPRLVDKRSGEVTRLVVPDAVALAGRMAHVRS